ncbi:hypothetical protein [Ruminococcus difficilis]|uniref:Uncharacterized protein n=1 Tax=Ruminococcus difficilis TaxID=2763069 RepID=A0A934WR84_9FIRM|nr:hypothetical protein [Ruminococcus difficilis]MBK6087650.1 hypothetical protein [Ruminococcus difficilis]
MFDIQSFIEAVFQSNITNFSERVSTCQIEITVSKSHLPVYNDLINCINAISFKNKVQIDITNPDEEVLFLSDSDKKSECEYNDYLSHAEEDDDFDVLISIEKVIVDNRFVVYNYKAFTEDILDNSIFEIMAVFSNFLQERDSLIVYVLDESIFWSTKTVMFTSNSDSCFAESINRASRIETCSLSSFFQSTGNFKLLPDDFDIINNTKNNPYKTVFNRLRTILSICYIASSSTIDNTHVKCIINGQRSITFERRLEDVNNSKTLYDIYIWIFTDGNIVDKAVIARNIISLHCKYCSILDIDSSVFISIISSYRLYLKENVSQYLEAKTKVSEFISTIGSKMTESAYELLNDFKKNIIAIFSFFLTVILVNVVSEHPLENLLTREITVIMELILLGSLAYYFISLIQSISRVKGIQKSYYSLRSNYVGVFLPEEIDDIFNKDNVFSENQEVVKKNLILFSAIWIGFVIIAFITIEMTSSDPVFRPYINRLFAEC